MGNTRVRVVKRSGRKFYQAEWVDAVTGQQRTRTTKQTRKANALRFAVQLEEQLNREDGTTVGNVTWNDFRESYERDELPNIEPATQAKIVAILNHVGRIINPKYLASLDGRQLQRLFATLRQEGQAPSTICSHISYLNGALRWAVDANWLQRVPPMRRPKFTKRMKGRPVTSEEFERMLSNTESVELRDLMLGLWWSGFRLGEAIDLTWDRLNLDAERPVFRIWKQKNRRDQWFPLAPEFVEFLRSRSGSGFVFDLESRRVDTNSKLVKAIGRAAKVKVDDHKGSPRWAGAHDFRRSFGTRWAARVLPTVLQQMMRHKSIETTMRYYVSIDAESAADAAWEALGAQKTDTFTDTLHL